jgi:hypothetical protein
MAILCVVVSGCASILSKSRYQVAVESSPSSANFVVKDPQGKVVAQGITPTTVTLPAKRSFFRRGQYRVEFDKAGYDSESVSLEGSLDAWYFGNVLLGGALGMLIVDPITGAMWELPDHVSTALSANSTAPGEVQQASYAEPAPAESPTPQPAELY